MRAPQPPRRRRDDSGTDGRSAEAGAGVEAKVKASFFGWRPLPCWLWSPTAGHGTKIVAGVFVLSLGLTNPVAAGSSADADAAYARGDYKTLLRILRPRAEQGDAVGQFNLALMYSKGKGVPQDNSEAVKWYRKAADQGYAAAQYNLALLYEKSLGAARDDAEATRLYRAAPEQGLADAQNNLCGMYLEGQGVSQDDAEAAKWCRKAADQGLAIAQYNLGLMYENGEGVPQDYVAAYMWLNLAASRSPPGDTEALDRRDLVAAKMTPAQITEGERLALEWKLKPK